MRKRRPPVRPDPLSEAAARRDELARAKAVQALLNADTRPAPRWRHCQGARPARAWQAVACG
jgi:hypothetical protein